VNVLVVAPHPDDECLGVGGTIALLADQGASVTVLTVAAHLPPLYPEQVHERTLREAAGAHELLGVADSVFLDHPAVLLADAPAFEVNSAVQRVVDAVAPELVFMPFPDRHVDHRRVFEACMVATRPVRGGRGIAAVAMYETLSETFWNAPGAEPQFCPNWTVDITSTVDRKITAYRRYESQVSPFPGPRSAEAVHALALFRGSQAGVAYGEAFQLVRATFSPHLVRAGVRPNPEGGDHAGST
jgi:LmbE family N-acetylglucosaminyl deacetylase